MKDYSQILKKFRQNLLIKDFSLKNYEVAWSAPSNIALIKYWGKYGRQLPINPSLSFSLEKSRTITKINLAEKQNDSKISLDFNFENKPNAKFQERIENYFESISPYCSYLKQMHFSVSSQNTFPHSAGIASSASAFSAIALCLASIENEVFGLWKDKNLFLLRASWLARLGSGSASRSVYPGFCIWGKTPLIQNSGNSLALKINESFHHYFTDLHDAILIVKSKSKEKSSSKGHELMNEHPYRIARVRQAHRNLQNIMQAMRNGDWEAFANTVENEALSLHALMMSSNTSFTLLEPDTLSFVKEIRKIREQNKLRLCLTLDAGPNLHIIYDGKQKMEVLNHLKPLTELCENSLWIDDKSGKGPTKL